MWPGAWAPSISVSTPRWRAAAHSWATGKISAVVLLMWLAKMSRVRGVMALSRRAAQLSASNGSGTSTRR